MFKTHKKLILGFFLTAGFVFYFHAGQAAAAPFTIDFDANPKSQVSGNFNFRYKLTYNGGAPAICQPTPQWRSNIVWEVTYKIDKDPNFRGMVRTGKFSLDQYSQGSTANLDFAQAVTPPTGTTRVTFTAAVGCERVPAEGVQTQAVSSPVSTGSGAGTGNTGTGRTTSTSFEIPNPLKGGADDLAGLVRVLAQWLFNLSIPIAVIMIIYAGILFLTAQGNPTTITKAKNVLWYAVVGLAIILIGSGFVTLIQSILDLGAPAQP